METGIGKVGSSAAEPVDGATPRPRVRGVRHAIVITGLHRCGTSALARVLSLAGAALPRHLMLSGEGHPEDGNSRSGFWESRPLADLDEAALQAAGSTWHDPAEPQEAWFDSKAGRRMRARLAHAIDLEYGEAPLFVVKDPRISRLVPLWKGALADLGIGASWLTSVRNPIECAASLQRRDGFAAPKVYWLWLRHFLAAERHTRGERRGFVAYEDLLADWRQVLARLRTALDLELPVSPDVAEEIEEFLAPALRHHSIADQEMQKRIGVSPLLREAYDWAKRAAREAEGDTEILDELLEEALRAEEAARAAAAAAASAEAGAPRPEDEAGRLAAVSLAASSGYDASRKRSRRQSAEQIERLEARVDKLANRLDGLAGWTELVRTEHAASARHLSERIGKLGVLGHGHGRDARSRLIERLPGPLANLLPARWRESARFWKEAAEVRASPLFDEAYYLERGMDVAMAGFDAAYHYVRFGVAEGRNPGPAFETRFYLARNPDVAASGINPLVHYLRCGRAEGRPARAADVALVPLPEPTAPAEKVRVVAFYLPQFHPIPENDTWWGKGFTEWTKVTAARPLFDGHQQPYLPTDLGYYDLRLPAVRAEQAALAREYGIDGFCYYYYWFNGRRLLERPLDDMLKSGEPDFPFCLCWANENWTRRWDGMDDEVLFAQKHTPEGDAAFIHEILPALRDRRYIRRNGKPVVIVYRADQLADAPATAAAWREAARAAGLPGLHLCAVWKVKDPRPLGFDAIVEFPPHDFHRKQIQGTLAGLDPEFSGQIFDYKEGVRALRPRNEEFPVHRGVMPRWDNTPRRDNAAWIFHGSSPELYRGWLERVIRESLERPGDDDQLVFVNAWNEWAEGAFLEPSQREGRRYLEATREAIHAARGPGGKQSHVLLFGHDACRAGAQSFVLRILEALAGRGDLDLATFLLRGGELEPEYARLAPLKLLPERSDATAIRAAVRSTLARRPSAPAMAICSTVLSWQAAATCAEMGIPVLSMIFELPTSIDALVGAEALRTLVESSERTLVASEFARDEISRRYGIAPERLTAFPAGWPATPVATGVAKRTAREEVRRRLGVARDAFLVLGCGSVHYRKGPDLFVQAARDAMSRPGAEALQFVWVGGPQDTPEMFEWCRHDLAASGLAERVRFVGTVEDVAPYFDAADAFLLTSREDPFPLVNLDALARGLPVVAFAGAGGAPEALADGAGVVVPYLDVGEMARAVLRLAGAPRHREEVQRRALAAHRERYDWACFVARFNELLRADFDLALPHEIEEPVFAARS